MGTTEKTCIACEGSGSEPCKAHIYEPEFLTTSDARFDYADVYYWPCCLENVMTEINEHGFDVFPKRPRLYWLPVSHDSHCLSRKNFSRP